MKVGGNRMLQNLPYFYNMKTIQILSRNFVKTYPLSAVSGVGFWAMAAAGGMTISSLELSACAPGCCCCCSWWASSVGGKHRIFKN